MSSSAPKIDHEWEPEFLFEEDYVPGALANEVLTPAEKARRGSTTNTLRGLDDGESLSMSIGASAVSTPGMTTKFGSPSAGSPSRWGPLFQRQKEEDFSELGNGSFGAAGGSTSRSMKNAASAFGHVGSPLRNSSLAGGIGAELMNGSGSGGGSSPARPGSGSRSGSGAGESLSALTQQLRQTSLDNDASPHLHPNAARASNGAVGGPGTSVIGRERERDRALERHVSSGSIGSSVTGRFTTPIDEEDPAFVFSMEEEDEANAHMRSRKRVSGGHLGAASPLGSGWTYASAVAAGKHGSTGNGNPGNGASAEAVGGS
jgi:cleavage and polyadenylation specificity factor subunit 4